MIFTFKNGVECVVLATDHKISGEEHVLQKVQIKLLASEQERLGWNTEREQEKNYDRKEIQEFCSLRRSFK